MKKIDAKLWHEFTTKWGSGFTLEAERDYKARDNPLVYHLKMYGLWADDDGEFTSKDINVCMRKAIERLKKNITSFKKINRMLKEEK